MRDKRCDLPQLKRCVEDLNSYYGGTGLGLWIPTEEEDYGLDLMVSGYTKDGEVIFSEVEVKAISYSSHDIWDTYGFLRRTACRNGSCRYGHTGTETVHEAWMPPACEWVPPTQEVIEADTTDKPAWAASGTPLEVLNASVKGGGFAGSKIDTLFKRNGYVVFMYEHGYLIFTPKDLKKAIKGYLWLKLPHSKWDREIGYELKAAVNLECYTRHVDADIPGWMLREN